jgi:serine/threonine protein kinase
MVAAASTPCRGRKLSPRCSPRRSFSASGRGQGKPTQPATLRSYAMPFSEPNDEDRDREQARADNPASPDAEGPDSLDGRPVPFPGADNDYGLAPQPKVKAQRVDPLLGLDLGGVKIVRLIGEGGMGRVYEAQQQNPPRTVAVKVVRQGLTSEKTMRRFEREAEFLGKLQHPGIAQIYVVGSYSSDIGDVPFFVMEFIPDAKPITNFTAETGLGIRETLGLFKQVCEAVSHGHDRGIIHRDLKPGNILIDANGAPKIIDFGVARSTDSDLNLTSMRTDTGALVGTVQYMSPEQFGDSAEGLDGRADVYALGVVLYELLAGVLPYTVRRKKMHEAARIVCEFVPPTLRSVNKSIPRGVSLIAERCLQKDRRGRYQSAGELAGDIQRVLDGQPVRMSTRSWLWRIREQLVSRYGRGVLLTCLAAACLGLILVSRGERPFGNVPTKTSPLPQQITGTWAEKTADGAPSERFRILCKNGDYIELNYGLEDRGRWELLPDSEGVRVTVQGSKPVVGKFVNGELHFPRPHAPANFPVPMEYQWQSSDESVQKRRP